MGKKAVCSYCGVPRAFSREVNWRSDGTISTRSNPDDRTLFCEADGVDQLLKNIEQLVGIPINGIVMEGKRKGTEKFLRNRFAGVTGAVIRAFFRRRVYEMTADLGSLFGYGHFDILDYRRGEYVRLFGRNIYSLPLFCGDLEAVFGLMEGMPADLEFEEREGGYDIRVTPGGKPEEEVVSRLQRQPFTSKPGNITFERCPKCGVPLHFKGCRWNMEEGTITDGSTGRRLALSGCEEIDSVFRELEAELGEDIPLTIVEAQRRYVVDAFSEEEGLRDPDNAAYFLALRGLGNLVRYDLGEERLDAAVENASPPLMVAGILQGIFELATGRESTSEYLRKEDGTLQVTVKAR